MMTAWLPSKTVLAFDLPGHGRSPWLTPKDYCVSRFADIVAETLAEHGIINPILIGHSLGARICAELAARPLMGLRGTVLIDMSPGGGGDMDAAIAAHIDAITTGATSLEGLVKLIRDRLPLANGDALADVVLAMAAAAADRWIVPLDPAIKQFLQPCRDSDIIWRLLSRLSGPVGIIRGIYSAALVKREAERMASVIPWQPVVSIVIEMAGHAIPLEQPERLALAAATCLSSWGIDRSIRRLAIGDNTGSGRTYDLG
jgi:pimeloyl-ACP methyl ester carboxylesterase